MRYHATHAVILERRHRIVQRKPVRRAHPHRCVNLIHTLISDVNIAVRFQIEGMRSGPKLEEVQTTANIQIDSSREWRNLHRGGIRQSPELDSDGSVAGAFASDIATASTRDFLVAAEVAGGRGHVEGFTLDCPE